MDELIRLEKLKRYYGAHLAFEAEEVVFPPGVIGLLGPNGAGKSTLLNMLMGLLEPSSGRAWMLGFDAAKESREVRSRVGYMPENDSFVAGLSVLQFVSLAGELHGLRPVDARRRAHEVLSLLGLEEARYRLIEEQPTGIRQRAKLAQALINNPDLVILDEPTNGLDPAGPSHRRHDGAKRGRGLRGRVGKAAFKMRSGGVHPSSPRTSGTCRRPAARCERSGATVLMLDDLTTDTNDKTVHSVAHGVVRLEELAPEYGAERRRLRVIKYRGRRFRGGYHDFAIETGGVSVFPRLVSAEHRMPFERDVLGTDSEAFNALLGGGIERGSSVLVLGPAGTGKSVLALTFIKTAISRGERAAMFVFDEEIGLLIQRAKGLGFDLQKMVDDGNLVLDQVDAAELAPGEFSSRVRRCVEEEDARTVVIDSLNGYQAAMPGENALVLHMHELLQYLNRQGATTLVTLAQHGLLGDPKTPVDVTYLADTVILLRYFEMRGRIRRAISVVKKRTGAHEDTIRELSIGAEGVRVGEAVVAFQGAARGVRSNTPECIFDRHKRFGAAGQCSCFC